MCLNLETNPALCQITDVQLLFFSQERQQFHLEQLRAAEFRARTAAAAQLSREQQPQVIGATPPQQQVPQQLQQQLVQPQQPQQQQQMPSMVV
jgi:SWI/SNF related-matrix-associated actin-dependent regulator of chromatin subfamily C